MITASVARRYARALLSLGVEEGRHEQYGDELELVLGALKESGEAAHILGDPGFTLQQRQAVVEALVSALRLSPLMVSFLRLLVDRKRSGDLPAIARAYRALLDQQVGRVRATVISAQPLSEEELSRLREAIARSTGRDIVLQAKTDPALIGGAVTQVGATLLDGSLRTQLERMREELKRAPL